MRRRPGAASRWIRAANSSVTGVDVGTLQRCQAHGRDGTRLERCVKLYLPSPGGAWRMVFEITRDLSTGELVLAYLAFGLGHPGKP